MSTLETRGGERDLDRAYVIKNGRDYYVPLSDGKSPGRIRDRGGVHWVRSFADIDALSSAKGWPSVQDIHPLAVVVTQGVPVNCTEKQYVWYVRFGVEGRWLRNCQCQVLYKMPSAVYYKYIGQIAQRHALRHSSLILQYQPPFENKRVLDPVANGFPLALSKHSREARMRHLRLLRGTLKALAVLILLRARAAERVYAPWGRGFSSAKLSFCHCAVELAAKRACV
jgi:hypothetical protein